MTERDHKAEYQRLSPEVTCASTSIIMMNTAEALAKTPKPRRNSLKAYLSSGVITQIPPQDIVGVIFPINYSIN